MATKKKMLQAAAGNATGGAGGAAAGLDVTDVFSTYLYEGTGSAQTITNGIDLDGEGGLVWTKQRDGSANHGLVDTERGRTVYLDTNSVRANRTTNGPTYDLTSFNSDGFSLGQNWELYGNNNGNTYVSWTFRKAPKFFDVVTWSGDSTSGREIAHNLGSAPGMIIVKRTNGSFDWIVQHRSLSAGYVLSLNLTSAQDNNPGAFTTTLPTSTVFTVGGNNKTNETGGEYVAYLFAHNDGDGEFGPDGDADVIKCGSYTGNNSANGPEIDLGFEPQWIMIKNATASQSWWMHDTMRGIVTSSNGSDDARLKANATTAEDTSNHLHVTPTGFKITSSASGVNESADYIYMAIRRGPLAAPESATDVFNVATRTSGLPSFEAPFAVDMGLVRKGLTASGGVYNASRLTGTKFLYTNAIVAEANDNGFVWDFMDGWANDGGTSSEVISWMWKRAPSFFDVVAYTGTGSAGHTVSHNLGVAPEMIWVKQRNTARSWGVYHKLYGGTHWARLNQSAGFTDNPSFWNDADSTSSVFTLGNDTETNQASGDYIAYLFASLPGISKVGSYTGTGNTAQTIDCGFTSGARFVLIKRSSGASQWHVFDTVRGMVSGNDNTLYLNSTASQVTNEDCIDPHSSGFRVVNSNGSVDTNNSNQNYIFYAIA